MSHDALDDNKILDFYNVPLDSDIYSAPIDYITNQYTIDSVLHKSKSSKPGMYILMSHVSAKHDFYLVTVPKQTFVFFSIY